MANPRRVVSSVVSGSGTAPSTTTTRELVVMRQELFTGKVCTDPDQLAQTLQRQMQEISEATQSARSLPVLGGAYWRAAVLVASTPRQFAHGLGLGVTVAFLPVGPNAQAAIWQTAQDTTKGQITLEASANVTVDLWFFPQPSAEPS